jgi:protein-tyrosine phosphatase
MEGLPGSILFACTWNAVRSPMAEGIMKNLFGTRLFVDSVGVRRGGELDAFAVFVLEEIGIDIGAHRPKTFDDLEDSSFDMVISLSPEAQHKAIDLTRNAHCEVEFWHTLDPSIIEGNREARLHAYREVRDQLKAKLLARFGPQRPPVV